MSFDLPLKVLDWIMHHCPNTYRRFYRDNPAYVLPCGIAGIKASGNGELDTALQAFINRATCYWQIRNFDGVIADSRWKSGIECKNDAVSHTAGL